MDYDFVIVGAGIAGAAVAAELALHGRTLALERDAQPGYHRTGRSAAVFAESYGPPVIRALTRASRAFLAQPPASFDVPALLRPLGALFIAEPGQQALLDEETATFAREAPTIQRLNVLGSPWVAQDVVRSAEGCGAPHTQGMPRGAPVWQAV